MSVGVVGSGPPVEAVRAALGDLDASVAGIDASDAGSVDLAVVAGPVGDSRFGLANADARAGGTPWLAVELGGVGGHPGVCDAAISGFASGTGCFACLRGRVAANLDADPETETDGDGAEPAVAPPTARLAGAIAGREAAALLSGDATVPGGVVELPYAERRFLPLPNCECAGERSRSLPRGHEPRALDEALARFERALDERVGVVREVGEVESFPAPYYLARTCDTSGFSDAEAASEAAGVDAGWDRAFAKALGEALERYSAGVYRAAGFTTAPAADLDDAVPPSAFVLSPAYDDPDPAEPIGWVPGEDLRTGDPASLPAEFVHFPPPAHRHAPSITTGLGLGNSSVEALLAGLYEVVERDATMLAWYSTFEPLGMTVDDGRFAELGRRARAEDLSVVPLLLTQDVDVPVVAVAVHREGAWPRFAVGSGAHLDPVAAARSALAEAVQNWMELRAMGREEAADAEGILARYAEFPDAARAFVDVDGSVPAARVGSEVPEGPAELDVVLERVADAGLAAYAARLTPRDVEALGFEAVRVLVPGAQPLFTDDPFFGDRAREVPADLGFEPRLDREHHPFP